MILELVTVKPQNVMNWLVVLQSALAKKVTSGHSPHFRPALVNVLKHQSLFTHCYVHTTSKHLDWFSLFYDCTLLTACPNGERAVDTEICEK